jgi:hypothetical protein
MTDSVRKVKRAGTKRQSCDIRQLRLLRVPRGSNIRMPTGMPENVFGMTQGDPRLEIT